MRYRYLFAFLATAMSLPALGQETVSKSNKVNNTLTENYQVLASDGNTRQGLYQLLYQKKTAIASGAYANGKRTGTWQFYDRKGNVIQRYNFDKKEFTYEAREDTTSNLHYFVDRTLDSTKIATEKVTKPLRIGGRYFGYLPYVSLFRMPKRYPSYDYDYSKIKPVVELLISPGGRLADYTVHLVYAPTAYIIDDIHMNLKLPNPDDLVFIPATYNNEPISCRIMIECVLNSNGTLDFAR